MQWKSKRLERINRKKVWHDFFCLIPRRITNPNGEEIWIWLETIERKGVYCFGVDGWYWIYSYRLKE